MKIAWKPASFLLLLMLLAWWCYQPGATTGGFLFDDFHNLESLGAYGSVHDWKTFYSYIHSGMAGPSGRPLALLSFLIDDNTWPSYAPWFKITNVWIHVLCGLLLCWINLLILRQLRFAEETAQWLAVIAAGCWFLHPLMLSTTLYVVQRMAQLATLFVLAGMLGYLKGRSLLDHSPRKAYGWMSFSLVLGTLFGVLSKENGALLPMMVMVFEFSLAGLMQGRCPDWRWKAIFLWAPSAAILGYLASLINFSAHPWAERNFNQPERLMTEARILWEYLRYIFLPQIEGKGLFQDGIEISKGLLTPWTTLPAVLGIITLFCFSFWVRRKNALLSFAILFFFVGHLIESTVIGLEPYFEHRNYLSAVFLFLSVVCLLHSVTRNKSKELFPIIVILILSFFSFLLWKRSELWANEQNLEVYWAELSPDSPRAQNALANFLLRSGQPEQAIAVLDKAVEKMPKSTLLNFSLLIQKVYINQASALDFEMTAQRARIQPFDAQAVMAIRTLVDNVNLSTSPEVYRADTLLLIDALEKNAAYGKLPLFTRLMPYLRAKIYLRDRRFEDACVSYQKASSLYNEISPGMMMVAENANAGNWGCAVKLLDQAEIVLKNQNPAHLDRPREDYEKDLAYLWQVVRAGSERSPRQQARTR
jgi:tetratricopeptide (TPR) repeat protein